MLAANNMINTLGSSNITENDNKEDYDLLEVLKFCGSSNHTERKLRMQDGSEKSLRF